MTLRTRDAEATRARVLEAATALFAVRGYAGVRLREIAERAQVSVPLMVHHFRDKDSLYRAVVDGAMERFAALGWDVLRGARTLAERMEALVTGLIDLVSADPTVSAILHREMADGGERARPLAEHWLHPLKQAATQEIRAAQRRGEMRRDLDPDLLVLHVVGAAVYPALASPIVNAVWHQDPLSAPLRTKRKRELLALLRPLILAARSTAPPRRASR